MASKVAQYHHHQLLWLLVVNESTGARVDIILKFGWVEHENGIPFMALIGLWTVVNMVLPQVCDRIGFSDPLVCRRIGGFQLQEIDLLNLLKI